MSIVRRHLLACVLLLGAAFAVQAGMNSTTAYTDRGTTDFDTFLQLLNPYGTWSKIDGKWAFTPTDHLAPYTDGRWVYTEFGWYWKGTRPHSWATEHYGYWKRGDDKVWSWYPGPFWLPEIVELRQTDKYIGWRSGEVDADGNFVEAPIDRYSKADEWTFVTKEQFANPIKPSTAASIDVTKEQLEDSTDCAHTYMTYREIDRPGPHPADEAPFCHDGGMLAPKSMSEEAAAQASPKQPDPNSPAAKMTGTNQPELIGADAASGTDMRKVKYWITMSLPTFWTKLPEEAKPEQIYLYRPDLYQDNDGIERRITLWFNPLQRTTLKQLMTENVTKAAAAPAATSAPEPSEAGSAFRSPLDDSYSGPAGGHPSPRSSTNSAAPTGQPPAPSGVIKN